MVGDYYYDNDDDTRRWPRAVVVGVVAVLIAGAGAWMVTKGDPQHAASLVEPAGVATVDPAAAPAVPDAAMPATTPTAPTPATDAPVSPTVTVAVPAPVASTIAADVVEVAAVPAPAAAEARYPTSSDGAPLPAIVVYDTDVITITGFVPSEAAKERLGALAVANSKSAARLVNQLVVNPSVPIGVGVRVLELDSVRFPAGSAEILPAHAAELERVAAVMAALPNVSVLVIGHADQRGGEVANLAVSAERATAVANFLTYLGVSPTRVSSRAVGEADLLTLDDDETALALNRRTEFVFYGVLAA